MARENDPDDTLSESPWAKQVEAAVKKAFAGVESRLVNEITAIVAPRFDQVNMELSELRQRVKEIERHLSLDLSRDTMPAPSQSPDGA